MYRIWAPLVLLLLVGCGGSRPALCPVVVTPQQAKVLTVDVTNMNFAPGQNNKSVVYSFDLTNNTGGSLRYTGYIKITAGSTVVKIPFDETLPAWKTQPFGNEVPFPEFKTGVQVDLVLRAETM